MFKFFSSIKIPGNRASKANLITGRLELMQFLDSQEGLAGFTRVPRDEYMSNTAFIPKLVGSYVQSLDDEGFDRILFAGKQQVFISSIDQIDPLSLLLNKSGQIPRLRDENIVDSIMAQYDFQYNGGSVFFRGVSGPIFIRQIGDVTLYFQNNFNLIDDILQKLVQVVYPYILYSEGYHLTNLKTLSYKRLILERFCRFGISDVIQNVNNVVEDAYSDLIKLSNIGQLSSMDLRYQRLAKERDGFANNLEKSLARGFYNPYLSSYEYSQYINMFQVLREGMVNFIPVIKGKKKNDQEYVKDYYIYDQLHKECNKLKVNQSALNRKILEFYKYNRGISGFINDIHPDVRIGLFNLSLHLKFTSSESIYFKGSSFCEVINLICSKYYRNKPVLIKMLIKNVLDGIYHDYKEDGLLMFHQLETLFGYRNSHLILDEVKDDYKSWFFEGYEKFEDIQRAFIHKWAPAFFKSKNYKGEYIQDKIKSNIRYYPTFEDILGSKDLYMTSKGSVDDFKITTKKGKTRNISKNMYFNVFQSQDDYEAKLENKEKSRRNKVIIKREEYIKQRIVINSTLDTFVPLSKLNKYLSVVTSGTGITYFSNTKQQKAEHYVRLQNYLLYNKYLGNKYLALPLDYSSYDHTITMGFIDATLQELANITGHREEVDRLIDQFKRILSKEVVYFEELGDDPINNQKYKYGMLSGWKITSSVESLGNAIISYGVAQELGEKMVDFETMGDDLILIYDHPNLNRQQQLEVLRRVCDFYSSLGFKMNVPKNSVGYCFLEFLRVTFLPGLVQAYPARVLGSLVVLKPGRTDATFGISEFQSVVRKVSKRYGITSQYVKIAQVVAPIYNRSDIRQFGVKFIMNPFGFEIQRREVIDFEINKKGGAESTPVFRRYQKILGDKYTREIKEVVEKYYLRRVIGESKLTPLAHSRAKPAQWQLDLIRRVFHLIRKMNPNSFKYIQGQFHFPDYHLSQLVVRIMRKLNFSACMELIQSINSQMVNIKFISDKEGQRNLDIINQCKVKADILSILDDVRIKAEETVVPTMIIGRAKRILISWLQYLLQLELFSEKEKSFLKSILNGRVDPVIHYILGQILSEVSGVINVVSGLPIAFRSD